MKKKVIILIVIAIIILFIASLITNYIDGARVRTGYEPYKNNIGVKYTQNEIFDNFEIKNIIETDKIGLEQIQEL